MDWLEKMRLEEANLKETLQAKGKLGKWTDWDTRLKNYREDLEKEDRAEEN